VSSPASVSWQRSNASLSKGPFALSAAADDAGILVYDGGVLLSLRETAPRGRFGTICDDDDDDDDV
jgi:hypothetical protein